MNNSVRRLSINANQPECQTQKNSQGLAAVMNRSRIWHKITVFIFDNRTSTFSEYAQIHQTLSKYIFGSAMSSSQISDSLFVCLSLDLPYHLKEGKGRVFYTFCMQRGRRYLYYLSTATFMYMQTLVNTVGTSNHLCIKIRMNWIFLMIHHRALGTISNQVSSSRGLLRGCPWFWKSGTPSGELGCP